MERSAIFLDAANLECAFGNLGTDIDYLGLRDYLAEGRFLVEAFVYVPINPNHPKRGNNLKDFLGQNGFLVRSKVGKIRPNNKWKCNFHVEMAIDILDFAQAGRVDIIVIGSGDGDLTPVCHEVRQLGIRCEVATTVECAAEELLTAASGYINLGTIILEQREQIVENNSENANPQGIETENDISK